MERPILEVVRTPVAHVLKAHPGPFQAVKSGAKTYELRVNDRDYRVGDLLVLHEFDPEREFYSGDVIEKLVTYMTPGGEWGLPANLCVLALGEPSP